MSDKLPEPSQSLGCFQSKEQLQTTWSPVQSYFGQTRSFLGKRKSGEDDPIPPSESTATMVFDQSRRNMDFTDRLSTDNMDWYNRAEGTKGECDSATLDDGVTSKEAEGGRYPSPSVSDDTISTGAEEECEDDDDDGRSLPPLEWDNIICTDGPADRVVQYNQPPVTAIFIHAGAGYHSVANERLHLDACSEAARASMKLLRQGRTAVEAVEAAIKVLEDKEITNSGYGSNLAIDGTVECDATVVDHLGRSGACGAVPHIKNPISLARLILETSNRPLSLRRVPPNLLVGDGAKNFAAEMGMGIVPNEGLVTRNALDRYRKWRQDLQLADNQGSLASTPTARRDDTTINGDHGNETSRDHANAILAGTWNEGQPDSPATAAAWEVESPMPSPQNTQSPKSPKSPKSSSGTGSQGSSRISTERSPLSFLGSVTISKGSTKAVFPAVKQARVNVNVTRSNEPPKSESSAKETGEARFVTHHDGSKAEETGDARFVASHDGTSELDLLPTPLDDSYHGQPPVPSASTGTSETLLTTLGRDEKDGKEDNVTDTVGAIAIDRFGHIAAGSSSGGIGMKHRGRVGPAALVGIGTAVIPADEHRDMTVAAVTSGTGEHMATTMASQKCAERIYHGTRRGPGGRDIQEDDESSILDSFILDDFESHPSVKNSASVGAIGVMAVKKGPAAFYLYFGHNTDSFALASMGSNDRDPSCVMSRIREHEGGVSVAQGARRISRI